MPLVLETRSRCSRRRSVRPRQRRFRVASVRKEEELLSRANNRELMSKASQIRDSAQDESVGFNELHQFTGLVAEAIYRTRGFRLFDVQLRAVDAGLSGSIVEMQTGEGKTVVAGAIAAIQTLFFPSVHVATTNTYLAQRDLSNLGPAFDLLGISAGLLPEQSDKLTSRRVYRNQIVYGPGYQFGFDYLRDQMTLRNRRPNRLGSRTAARIAGTNPLQKLMQPTEHHLALIDEADSVMIDEAMTPLVISLPVRNAEDPAPYLLANQFACEMKVSADFTFKTETRKIELTESAMTRAHEFISNEKKLCLYRPWHLYISNAVRAHQILERNVDYVVVDGSVQIVDQNTGRILPDRTWQDGLHQAVEAKEKVKIQPGRASTAQVTRQRYFQMYEKLTGLTGTAKSVESEFRTVYRCPVVTIPKNLPCQRKLEDTRFFYDQESKTKAIVEDVRRRHRNGQPVLIGTRTIRESVYVRDEMTHWGLNPTVLNGVQDQDEAEVIAQAGKAGTITIATNMAGRGTDIKLDQKAIESGGLHVVGFSPNQSRRIDRQLVGRAARQGQPGSAQFFAGATDDVFVEIDSKLNRSIIRSAGANGEARDHSRELAILQRKIEAGNYKKRRKMMVRDCWIDSVREAIDKD